jgi:hypothetical protein
MLHTQPSCSIQDAADIFRSNGRMWGINFLFNMSNKGPVLI